MPDRYGNPIIGDNVEWERPPDGEFAYGQVIDSEIVDYGWFLLIEDCHGQRDWVDVECCLPVD